MGWLVFLCFVILAPTGVVVIGRISSRWQRTLGFVFYLGAVAMAIEIIYFTPLFHDQPLMLNAGAHLILFSQGAIGGLLIGLLAHTLLGYIGGTLGMILGVYGHLWLAQTWWIFSPLWKAAALGLFEFLLPLGLAFIGIEFGDRRRRYGKFRNEKERQEKSQIVNELFSDREFLEEFRKTEGKGKKAKVEVLKRFYQKRTGGAAYRTKQIDYIGSFGRSNKCPDCRGQLEEFTEEGVPLTQCRKCGVVRPIRGAAIYDVDALSRIAAKFPNFEL